MLQDKYEIGAYRDNHFDEVVSLLRYLYGDRPEANAAYFRWKYGENPATQEAPGVVALHEGKVVGFRGYWATRWHIPADGSRFTVLCSGDTCVHPDHRMKGLSVAMGSEAMDRYSAHYPLFLNISAIRTSVRGYLKMGFAPLAEKTYLRRYNLLTLAKNRCLLSPEKRRALTRKRIVFGDFGDITVSGQPRPEEMAAVVSGATEKERRMLLLQDEDFFRWRFRNSRKEYIFYYHLKNGRMSAYLVLCMHDESRHGHILDFAGSDREGLAAILGHIVRNGHADIISVLSPCLDQPARQVFTGMDFRERGVVQRKKEKDGVWPFFVRPVRKRCHEEDWFIGSMDTREIGNWGIKDIYNDAF